MNFNILKIGAAFLFSTMILGCANSVPQVRASLPLVSAEQTIEVGLLLPSDISALIGEGHPGQALIYRNYQLVLGHGFYSALGQQCKEVHFSELNHQTESYLRIACQGKTHWRLMPIITEQNNLDIDMEDSK